MISVITPTVRKDSLLIVDKCLRRQNVEYEWLVASPDDYGLGIWVKDPPRKEGDYYSLNKAWNETFKQARGELIVSIQDGIWFEPTLLERFWQHYEANPKSIVGAVGHQYDHIENGKPENIVWRDPRIRIDQGSFYETLPTEIEWTVCSFPKAAIFDVGGMPEEYDKGAALSEKITNLRFEKAGYKLYLDQSLEYRAVKHERLGGKESWDKAYRISSQLYSDDARDIIEGRRRQLDYLSEK